MTLLESIKSLLLLPKARKHLNNVMQELLQFSYSELIERPKELPINTSSVKVKVKSYFWASRTIKNCKCLPRSIALYQRLRADGHQVEHKFGVNRQDKTLEAHAWVELNNKPLNESEDLKQRFEVMNYPD